MIILIFQWLLLAIPIQSSEPIRVRSELVGQIKIDQIKLSGHLKKSGPNLYRLELNPVEISGWQKLRKYCLASKISIALAQTLHLGVVHDKADFLIKTSRRAVNNMAATVSLQCKDLTVSSFPVSAIVSPNGSETYFMFFKGDTVIRREVQLWRYKEKKVLSFDRFSPQERVIVSALHRIVHGDKVIEVQP